MEPRPRIAVVVAIRNTDKNSLRGVRKYHRLVIHTNRGFNAVPDVQPLIGVIVAEMPQSSERGKILGAVDLQEGSGHGRVGPRARASDD